MTEPSSKQTAQSAEIVSDKIFTIPNLISFIRLCLVPLFVVLLVNGFNIAAAILFAVAAGTDFIDGQIARRTHSVSRLGQLLDPVVDRALMLSGVITLFVIGRLPLWILVLALARDLLLLCGGGIILYRYHLRVPVVYAGKVATTFLFFGFAGLILNMPQIPGLGLCDFPWLPGFNGASFSWGIWPIYIGLLLAVGTTSYYVFQALKGIAAIRKAQQ